MILLVCGFGRCGSSLVMRMLEAGGMPVAGEYPDYERFARLPTLAASLAALDGHAVKLLDPQEHPIPPGPQYRAVWLKRDPRQQALSSQKFLRAAGARPGRGYVARAMRAYREDEPRALAHLRAACTDVMVLRFEGLLEAPVWCACRLADAAERDLDVMGMAGVVLPRDANCRPDMAIEAQLAAETREG